MKLFKQQGWGCQHVLKEKIKAKKEGIEYKGDRACQACLRHDWWWSTGSPYYIAVLTYPFWWLKYGRHMDKKGFMPDEKLKKIVEKHLGIGGRMISFSKSFYRQQHPNNTVYFNAQIHSKKRKFIWAGDLDITKDLGILEKIAEESSELFYVTPELWMNEFNKETIKLDSTLKFGEK